MEQENDPPSGEETGETIAGVEGIERIRKILVGTQHEEFRQRFERLEQQLDAEAKAARAELSTASSALEAFIYNETRRLEDQMSERLHAQIRELTQRFIAMLATLEKSLGDLDERKLDRTSLGHALAQVAMHFERDAGARARPMQEDPLRSSH